MLGRRITKLRAQYVVLTQKWFCDSDADFGTAGDVSHYGVTVVSRQAGTIAVIPLRARNRLHGRAAKSAARTRHPGSLRSTMLPAAEGRL
jgi:hypothetical protein